MFGEHLLKMRDLMEIKRYQNRYKHKERSVAEHSWFVTKIAHGLATWEKYKFKTEGVDIEEVLFFAINHDIVEVYTGDIISTTKRISPQLKDELDKVEELIFREHIPKTIPNSWGKSYIDMNERLKSLNCMSSRIVKASDLIDRVFECMEEIELGNKTPFEEIVVEDLGSLFKMDLISVDYFLKYSIKDINAYHYIDKAIQTELENMDFSPFF